MNEGRKKSSSIRKPVFAGRFYPADKEDLTSRLGQLFSEAAPPVSERCPQALIAPHAAYEFSGEVAASAYNQLPEGARFKRVFLLASSHSYRFSGASIDTCESYETTLGSVKVDTRVASHLCESTGLLSYRPQVHVQEHSLEVQLPLLQYKLGNDFLLIPIVLGTRHQEECEIIARSLKPWFTPENLFVVSTDFSHYPSWKDAVDADLNTAQAICSNNPEDLLNALDQNKHLRNLATSLCGWPSVLVLLYLTRTIKNEWFRVLYKNSGDVPQYGDKQQVVGYWAMAVQRQREGPVVPRSLQADMLDIARQAVYLFLLTGKMVQPKAPETLKKCSAGMFVSIYVNDRLRGCIGTISGGDPLDEALTHLVISASCDNRFDSLRLEEFPQMQLEISMLSPLRKISAIDEIIPGEHGVYIEKGENSGTFLPAVAVKMGWSVEELLGHCSRDKADLGWNGWKNADIFVYEVFAFRG